MANQKQTHSTPGGDDMNVDAAFDAMHNPQGATGKGDIFEVSAGELANLDPFARQDTAKIDVKQFRGDAQTVLQALEGHAALFKRQDPEYQKLIAKGNKIESMPLPDIIALIDAGRKMIFEMDIRAIQEDAGDVIGNLLSMTNVTPFPLGASYKLGGKTFAVNAENLTALRKECSHAETLADQPRRLEELKRVLQELANLRFSMEEELVKYQQAQENFRQEHGTLLRNKAMMAYIHAKLRKNPNKKLEFAQFMEESAEARMAVAMFGEKEEKKQEGLDVFLEAPQSKIMVIAQRQGETRKEATQRIEALTKELNGINHKLDTFLKSRYWEKIAENGEGIEKKA